MHCIIACEHSLLSGPSISISRKGNVSVLIQDSHKISWTTLGRKVNHNGSISQNGRRKNIVCGFAAATTTLDLRQLIVSKFLIFQECDGAFASGMVDRIREGPDKSFGSGSIGIRNPPKGGRGGTGNSH